MCSSAVAGPGLPVTGFGDGPFQSPGRYRVQMHGEYSSLGHLQHRSVRANVGDRVTRGQVIGKVGSSGPSEHPHLHYQLMAGTHLTRSDGLPSQFVNVWLEDTRAREPVQIKVPKRGLQLVAR